MKVVAAHSPLVVVIPAFITVVMTALTAAPVMFAGGLTPLGFMVCVVWFSLVVPRAMPVWLVVLISLFADTMMGAPLGANGVVALWVTWPLKQRAKIVLRQPQAFIWLAVAATLLASQILMCGMLWVFGFKAAWLSAGAAWLVTLPLVPVMGWMALRLGEE